MRILILGLALAGMQIAAAGGAELTGTLKRISDSGRINLGFRDSNPPMSFRDQSGKAIGYSVDLCNHIATAVKRRLGRSDIKVSYVPVTAKSRFPAIEAGKIDILCGATTKTLSRAKRVGFTQLTFITGASLLGRSDSKIAGITDLQGKRVAVVANTTTIDALKRTLKDRLIDAQVVPVSSASEGMAALDKRDVDAFSSDQVVLIGQMFIRKDLKRYYLSKELFSYEPFALAIRRGDPDFQGVADAALSRLNRGGQIVAIYQRWFRRFAKTPPAGLRALYQLNATPE